MAWYGTGSINLTNGSPTVTGVGTDFVSNVLAGQGLTTQDGRLYEIAAVVSATSLTLRTPYYGGTAGAAAYAILPTQSLIKDLADQAAALIGSFANVRDGIGAGLLQDGTVGVPGLRFAADQDTGFRRVGNNMLSMVTSGVDRLFVGANGVGVGSAPDGRSGLLVQGVDQQTAALVDGGAHGGSIMLRANGVGAGDGGAVLFATTFTNGTPFAAVKGLVSDGSGGTVGDLAFAVRGAVTDGTLTERMRLSTKGYLGLGCTPLYQFHVQGAGQQATDLTDAGAKGGSLYLQDSSNGGLGAGGALLFGVTNGYGTPFASIKGSLQDAANGTKGNLVFGTRGATNATSIVARWILFGDGGFAPAADNAYDIGNGALRARTVYSASGVITTSDERMKQQIGDIPDDWLDAWGSDRRNLDRAHAALNTGLSRSGLYTALSVPCPGRRAAGDRSHRRGRQRRIALPAGFIERRLGRGRRAVVRRDQWVRHAVRLDQGLAAGRREWDEGQPRLRHPRCDERYLDRGALDPVRRWRLRAGGGQRL